MQQSFDCLFSFIGFIHSTYFLKYKSTGGGCFRGEKKAYRSMKQQENGVNAPPNHLRDKRLLAEPLPRACSPLISDRVQQACILSCAACRRRALSWRVVNKIFRKALARSAWQRGLIGFLPRKRRWDRPVRLCLSWRLKNVQGKREEQEAGANVDFTLLILTNLWALLPALGLEPSRASLCLPVFPSPQNGPSSCYNV